MQAALLFILHNTLLTWEVSILLNIFPLKIMEQQHTQEQSKINTIENEEASSTKWEYIKMTEQEEDLIYRMHKLVGDRWDLVAGRIPGRKAEEIERFWIMRHCEGFNQRRKVQHREQ